MSDKREISKIGQGTSSETLDYAAERDSVMHKWVRQDTFSSVFITRAAGTRLTTDTGRTIFDAFSQDWFVVAGHGRTEISDAISDQAHTLATVHAGRFATSRRGELARRLLGKLRGDFRRIIFGANGSDAVEASLKAARLGTGRQGIIAFTKSYHGASAGATSVTGLPQVREGFGEPVPGTSFVPYPDCYRCPFGKSYPSCDIACADFVEEAILVEGPNRIAAIIGEPIRGSGGIAVPPDEFWPRIREIADRHGIWLIFDEVVNGFGRTGAWFAHETVGVEPDILTLAKGLTSGYQPLSAAVLGRRAEEALADRPWYYGMSNQGHAVACAAAMANLNILEEEELVERATQIGDELGTRLAELAGRHRCIGDVRGRGAMWGIELVRHRPTKQPFTPGEPFRDSQGNPVNVAHWAYEELFNSHDVHIGAAADVLLLAPPLITTTQEIDELVAAISSVLKIVDEHCRDD